MYAILYTARLQYGSSTGSMVVRPAPYATVTRRAVDGTAYNVRPACRLPIRGLSGNAERLSLPVPRWGAAGRAASSAPASRSWTSSRLRGRRLDSLASRAVQAARLRPQQRAARDPVRERHGGERLEAKEPRGQLEPIGGDEVPRGRRGVRGRRGGRRKVGRERGRLGHRGEDEGECEVRALGVRATRGVSRLTCPLAQESGRRVRFGEARHEEDGDGLVGMEEFVKAFPSGIPQPALRELSGSRSAALTGRSGYSAGYSGRTSGR